MSGGLGCPTRPRRRSLLLAYESDATAVRTGPEVVLLAVRAKLGFLPLWVADVTRERLRRRS
jgi:hypothetical protein